jgi:hypothetical protein
MRAKWLYHCFIRFITSPITWIKLSKGPRADGFLTAGSSAEAVRFPACIARSCERACATCRAFAATERNSCASWCDSKRVSLQRLSNSQVPNQWGFIQAIQAIQAPKKIAMTLHTCHTSAPVSASKYGKVQNQFIYVGRGRHPPRPMGSERIRPGGNSGPLVQRVC